MNGILFGGFLILVGIGFVIYGILWEEKRMSKISGRKVRNLKALREELLRDDEKQLHAAETAAKRAERAQAQQDTLENAQNIRDLVNDLNRDARTAYMLAHVPTIQVHETGETDSVETVLNQEKG